MSHHWCHLSERHHGGVSYRQGGKTEAVAVTLVSPPRGAFKEAASIPVTEGKWGRETSEGGRVAKPTFRCHNKDIFIFREVAVARGQGTRGSTKRLSTKEGGRMLIVRDARELFHRMRWTYPWDLLVLHVLYAGRKLNIILHEQHCGTSQIALMIYSRLGQHSLAREKLSSQQP